MTLSKFDDFELVEFPEHGLVMKRIIARDQHGEDISISWVEIKGRHRRMKTDRSQRIYYVIKGTGEFTVDGSPTFHIGPRDSVVIPRATPYEFSGDLEYLVINTPAWQKGDDIDVE